MPFRDKPKPSGTTWGGYGKTSWGKRQPPKKVGPKPKLGAAPETKLTRHAGPAPRATDDEGYLNRVNTAEGKGQERLAALGNQEGDIKRDYGIEDPSDPFNRANGLKQSFLARMKGRSAGLASQGQLYSGAHERAISRTRREEEEARAELRKSYESAIAQVGAERAGVKWATEEEKNQAFEDWLNRAPEAEVEVTEDEIQGSAGSPDGEAIPLNQEAFAKLGLTPEQLASAIDAGGVDAWENGGKAPRGEAAIRARRAAQRQAKRQAARAEKKARAEAQRERDNAASRGPNVQQSIGAVKAKPRAGKPKPRRRGRR